MDSKDNNKDINMLKNDLWTKRVNTEVEVIVLRENQVVKEIILLDDFWKNNTREQEVQKELEKEDRQA